MYLLGRKFTIPLSLSLGVLLGGCVVADSQAWLTPDSFARTDQVNERIDTLEDSLEHSLKNWCVFQDGRSQAQLASTNATVDLLRTVHSDVQQLRLAQRTVTPECPPTNNDSELGEKQILGEVEWVGLPSIGTYLESRVDTGAASSSLSARDITPFERDGEDWVRFKLALDDDDAVVDNIRDKNIEAKRVRTARIRQASGTDERPVIELPVKMGNIEQTVEFTLTDRSRMTYPILLGRNFLRDIAVVDVSRQYTFDRPEYSGGAPVEDSDGDESAER
jgi:hypothetical protein